MRKLPSGHLPTLLRQGSVGFAPFAASFAAPGTTPATGALYFGVSRLSRLRECTLMRSLLVQPSRDTAYITCGATQGARWHTCGRADSHPPHRCHRSKACTGVRAHAKAHCAKMTVVRVTVYKIPDLAPVQLWSISPLLDHSRLSTSQT